jgi:hypothetical protein
MTPRFETVSTHDTGQFEHEADVPGATRDARNGISPHVVPTLRLVPTRSFSQKPLMDR